MHDVEDGRQTPDIPAMLRSADRRADLVSIARRLVAVASPNPPLNTESIAEMARSILLEFVPGVEVELHRAPSEVVNLVAKLTGSGPGRRIAFSGHLDTFPLARELPWTVDPLEGHLHDGKLYGRGVADMKGGIAASICALALLSEHRDAWRGEVVLTLGGDEETMGELGAQFLLDTVPGSRPDAVIIGDVGSPRVVRIGEKGFLWITIEAEGVAAHGAHVHRGINAIDRLRTAMDMVAALRELPAKSSDQIASIIRDAKAISEPLSGAGELEVLNSITVNFGRIEGGISPNLVPASAMVAADIRIPIGFQLDELIELIDKQVGALEGVKVRIYRKADPALTSPDHPIVRLTVASAAYVMHQPPAVNVRVGASDARVFRKAGIPTVVYGPTPFSVGGADEYVLIDELETVMKVHAITAFKFLCEGLHI